MRNNYVKQMPLTITSIDPPHAKGLEGISQILDANPIIYKGVLQDFTHSVRHVDTGAEGMSAEQVLRAAIISCHATRFFNKLSFISHGSLAILGGSLPYWPAFYYQNK